MKILLGTALLALPLLVLAAEKTEWKFNGVIPMGFITEGDVQTQIDPDGLLMRSITQTIFARNNDISHPVDTIEIVYSAPQDAPVELVWHNEGMEPGTLTRLPLGLEPSLQPKTIKINTSYFDNWDPHFVTIGFLMPQDTVWKIHSIAFVQWSFTEKMTEAWKSFWSFDTIKAYSINFLWGPQIALNPIGTAELWSFIPPRALFGSYLFYFALTLAAVVAFLIWLFGSNKAWRIFGICALIVWFAYDVRMSGEFMSNLTQDYSNYTADKEKTYRNVGPLPFFAQSIRPSLEDRERYMFLGPARYPYLGMMRYYTYPRLPVAPEDTRDIAIDTWVIFNRPDIEITESGQLKMADQLLTPPGTVLYRYDDSSFVYRISE